MSKCIENEITFSDQNEKKMLLLNKKWITPREKYRKVY